MPEPAQKKNVPPDFVPREYVPPAVSVASGAPRDHGLPGPAQRKETIDRLENWLKNIMKER
jgi:hypothetical protein